MAIQNDNHGGHSRGGVSQPDPSRPKTQMPWLPTPEAPANDNELKLLPLVRAFLTRHLNWLVPTVALAACSIALLFFRA